ncbi:MAG: single-stranded-DNA-specific exonuclease RecJ [Spirochaetia bacterium]|jgi:single-stranded-DNA-specific exonuclease|nr:single-stranded-DNA-specific exonuclease RecJ [Spirochaetia bacterium]
MKWIKNEINQEAVKTMVRRYGIDSLSAAILARRKQGEPSQVLYYLENDLYRLRNPFFFAAMEDAVDRIFLAADEGEQVLVFGDSDTDGVTATTLLVESLAALGVEAEYRVPQGEEAYGLSLPVLEAFAAKGGGLIITVDCGISNHAEVLRAAELGIDVIICDHHRLQASEPPEALAVIDPKIEDCGYPFRDLAGAGVAFKMAAACAFGKTSLYKQPVALLSIEKSGEGEALRWKIEAVKLHNLVETSRFSEILDEKKASVVLDKLARFLNDRSIFVWGKKDLNSKVRMLFGSGIEIESFDLADEGALLFASWAGRSLSELRRLLKVDIYAEKPSGDIDALKAAFEAIAWERAFSPLGGADPMLQLATLGTIADIMPLQDENRIIVRRGLASIAVMPRNGLRELFQIQGLSRKLNATEIAWQITPLLNAAGRIGKPEIALKLLMAKESAERMEAGEAIVQANNERKKMGTETWEALYPSAGESFEKNGRRFILLGSPLVKSGITGLLASRMAGTFKVPSIVAAFRENGMVVGSVRSANGFKISGLLEACAELFIDYGGHDVAAGFSMPKENWDRFIAIAEKELQKSDTAATEESLQVDAELPHPYLRPELQKLCAQFEPFGEANPPLVFFAREVPMADAQIVGRSAKSHLKLTLDFGAYKWPALLWDGAERLERDFSFKARDKVDLLFKLGVNRWNGEERPQLELFDIRKAGGKD